MIDTPGNRPDQAGFLERLLPRRRFALLRQNKKLVFFIFCMGSFLALLGFATHNAIETALKQVLAEYLNAVLEADVAALQMWFEEEEQEVRRWAAHPAVVERVAALSMLATDRTTTSDTLLADSAQQELRRFLSLIHEDENHVGFQVYDRTGLILAAHDDPPVGRRLNGEGMALLGKVFEKGPFVSHPLHTGSHVSGQVVDVNRPVMLSLAAVQTDDEQPIGAIALLINPEQEFTRIISIARVGATGNTYAFNRNGVILSDSRFEEQLKEIGLLPNTNQSQSILNLEIRDPGGDLTRGFQPDGLPAARPLTAMAASATSGQNGYNLEGYRDFRGVPVLGAWRWLPDYDLGLAAEVSIQEALDAIRPLTYSFRILFWLLVLVMLGILVTNAIISRLRRDIRASQRIDKYTLERKIGGGGMGEVYLARHALLRRATAIKLLHTDQSDTTTLERFEREVQLTSQLAHPNTIEIYDHGVTDEGIFYYVMEYLHGITLARLLELQGEVPPDRVIHILRQVCGSLREAHAHQLIHRDIKPLNIMLCDLGGEPDFVKVLDFGLVKELAIDGEPAVTSTNVINGTPLYIAPERLRDPTRVDTRTDIYSLGVVAFNLLTAQELFEGATAMELSQATLASPVPRPSSVAQQPIPAQLDELVVRCLAKNPDDRPQRVDQIIDELEQLRLEHPWSRAAAVEWWQRHADQIDPAPGDPEAQADPREVDTGARTLPVMQQGRPAVGVERP
ncbi:MAG TPA: serine/threonine protein kinase [Candidatus Sumerlaeota bacterium]|nr:serine/threonine protein kinase [Candidatus Sumerlaeota bacterium]